MSDSSKPSHEKQRETSLKRKVCELDSNNAVSLFNENGIMKYVCGKSMEAKQSFIEALAREVEISSNEAINSSIMNKILKMKPCSPKANDRTMKGSLRNIQQQKKSDINKREHYDEGMHVYNDTLHIYDSIPMDLRYATLLYNIGLACVSINYYEEARSWFELALTTIEKSENHFSNTSVNVVKVKNNLGHCFYRLGKNEEAMKYYQEALVHVDKMDPIALAAGHNCVAVLHCHNAGNLTKATEFFQLSLSTYRTIIGDFSKEVGTILNNIGRVHYVSSEYEEALLVYEEALKIRRQVLGNDSIDVAATLFNTGQTYHQLGKLDEAMSIYKEFINLVTSHLGSDTRDVADAYKCMGMLCTERNEIDHARSMYKLALDFEKVAFGENHPKLAATLCEIGILCFKMKDSDAALKYFQEKLNIEKKSSNQRDAIITLLYIVQVYKHNGDFVKAVKAYKEIRMHQINIHGYISLEVATTLTSIGWLYHVLNYCSKSLKYCQEALHVRRDYHGSEDNLDIAKEWNSIGLAYSKLGKYEQSKDAFIKSIRIRQSLLGPVHKDIAVLWFNIGFVCMAGGDDEQGIKCYKEALRLEQKILGDGHIGTSPTLQQIAEAHRSRGELDEAIWYYNKVLDIERKNKGKNSTSVFKLLNLIGNIHLMNGNVDEMMTCYIESVRSRLSCQEGGHELLPLLLGHTFYGVGKLYSTCAQAA